MRLDYLTIFPEFFDVLGISLLGKAVDNGIVDIHAHDLRTWTHDRHRTVDDTPCGGGAGMVMKPDPWGEAFDDLLGADPDPGVHVVIPTPRARRFVRMTPRSCPMPIASSSAVDATRASTIASSTMPASTGAFMSSVWVTTSSMGERWLRSP